MKFFYVCFKINKELIVCCLVSVKICGYVLSGKLLVLI